LGVGLLKVGVVFKGNKRCSKKNKTVGLKSAREGQSWYSINPPIISVCLKKIRQSTTGKFGGLHVQ
jgi:hypothetical protein